MCAVGNMILHFWCSHQFLYRAGSPTEHVSESGRWNLLRGWYSHMNALRQFIELPELQTCLKRSSFPFNDSTIASVTDWVAKSIGNGTEEPKLLFNQGTGLIDIRSFTFASSLKHSRRNVAPKNRVCLPLADPTCWPEKAHWQTESCTLCCDPTKGPFGDPGCWTGNRSWARCCQPDFSGVMCDEIRRSTPGCLDCPQHLSFYCEEEHKFRVVRAWSSMNETFWKHKEEFNNTRDLQLGVFENEKKLELFDSLFKSSLIHFVGNQTRFLAVQRRVYEFQILRQNQTIAKMQTARKPVDAGFTSAKRDSERAISAYRTANETFHRALLAEASERARIADLVNKTVQLNAEYSNLFSKFQQNELKRAIMNWKKNESKNKLDLVEKILNQQKSEIKTRKLVWSTCVAEKHNYRAYLAKALVEGAGSTLPDPADCQVHEWMIAHQISGFRVLENEQVRLREWLRWHDPTLDDPRAEMLDSVLAEKEGVFAELDKIPGVIANLTKIQSEYAQSDTLVSNVFHTSANFSQWNISLTSITFEIKTENMKLHALLDIDQEETLRTQYGAIQMTHHNNSDWLNKTFTNLTEYRNNLDESVNKTVELAETFKKVEIEYFRFEKIYNEKLNNGEIVIKDFKFEY